MKELPSYVAIFDPVLGKYRVGMLSNQVPITYTIQNHLGEFGNSFDAEKAGQEAQSRG